MISAQPAIPLLVHEDCMDGIKTDLAGQQEILSKIKENTRDTVVKIDDLKHGILQRIYENAVTIGMDVSEIGVSTNSIKTSSSNTATQLGTIKTDTTALTSSVGTTADASTENTVIGLLKSISNKLSLSFYRYK